MNNILYNLARMLRGKGHRVTLVQVPGAVAHFRAEKDLGFRAGDERWVLNLGWKDVARMFWARSLPEGIPSSAVHGGCGWMIGLLRWVGQPLHFAVPYGADLTQMPFFRKIMNWGRISHWAKLPVKIWRARFQRLGLQSAHYILINADHRLYREAAERLGLPYRNSLLPFLHPSLSLPGGKGWHWFRRHDFVLFHHARHLWATNTEGYADFANHRGDKRNDRVIRAFAKFVRSGVAHSPVLVLFEHGDDVQASKALVQQLNLGSTVRWFPPLPRAQILGGLARAHLAINQLRENLCGLGGCAAEALFSGCPCITHTDGAVRDPRSPWFGAPILEALTEEDVLRILQDCHRYPAKYRKIGRQGRAWYLDAYGRKLASDYDLLVRNSQCRS